MKQHKHVLVLVVFMLTMFVATSAFAMSTFVPGAHSVKVIKLDDLTTNNADQYPSPKVAAMNELGRQALAPNDWFNGAAVRPGWYTPYKKVAGYMITGYIDDARFVMRVPFKWNGKLVMSPMPGLRDEWSSDAAFSDFVLTKFNENGESYAYAAIDKGTVGELVPNPDLEKEKDGTVKILPYSTALTAHAFSAAGNPNDTLAEWNLRLGQATRATKIVLEKLHGKQPTRTYLMGHSNGGYVVRYALEKDGAQYDGGIDWEGMLWNSQKSNMIDSLSKIVNAYLTYSNKKATDEQRKQAADVLYQYLEPGSEFIWPQYFVMYWLGTLDIYRNHFDPTFQQTPWNKYLTNPTMYLKYDYKSRPESVKEAIRAIENTGDIQKPMISVFGSLDSLTSVKTAALPYKELVEENKKGDIYRLFIVKNGNHLDGWVGSSKFDKENKLQPLLPYVHQSFDLLVDWVENGKKAPASKTIPIPTTKNKVIDIKTGDEVDPY